MLGTREPVTPCLVAQNLPRLPPLEAALGCAWKQASPIISYKILERAPKLARKIDNDRLFFQVFIYFYFSDF